MSADKKSDVQHLPEDGENMREAWKSEDERCEEEIYVWERERERYERQAFFFLGQISPRGSWC